MEYLPEKCQLNKLNFFTEPGRHGDATADEKIERASSVFTFNELQSPSGAHLGPPFAPICLAIRCIPSRRFGKFVAEYEFISMRHVTYGREQEARI